MAIAGVLTADYRRHRREGAARRTAVLDAGGLAKVRDDGSLDLPVGGQTTVTVELSGPVRFVRPLGKEAEARVLRFYTDDPEPAVAALTRSVRHPDDTPRSPKPVVKR